MRRLQLTQRFRPSASVAVVDLDSTLCDTSPRHHLVPVENRHANESWHPYSLACYMDVPLTGMIAMVNILSEARRVVILSGRMDVAQDASETWLDEHGVIYDDLRLRRDSELGSVPEFKIGVLRDWQEQGMQIDLMVDDFPDLCAQVTAELGIPTISPVLPAHYATTMPGL